MPAQVFRDGSRVGLVLSHANRERLETSEAQPAVPRPRYRPGGVLIGPDRLVQLLVAGQDSATDDIAMAADVLGGAVNHDVGTLG